MVEYRRAREEEAADVLDLINYVFSQAHRPHDFRRYNPAMYDSGYPFWQEHYVAVENGRLRATLSINEKKLECAGETFLYGHVGQVSVHPYARGEGHMKRLMQLSDEDMQKNGYDFAELGGLRQRYGYFGYTQGRPHYAMTVSPTNTRHALMGRECCLTAKVRPHESGFTENYDLIDGNGSVVGRAGAYLLELNDLSLAPDACEAYFRASGDKEMRLSAGMHEMERIRALNAFCETVSLNTAGMYRIYHFEKYLRAALTLRAQYAPMQDGQLALEIAGEPIAISVRGGQVKVEKGEMGAGVPMTAMQAQEMLFSPATAALYPWAPAGWFPATVK